jgi:hypothetical protein
MSVEARLDYEARMRTRQGIIAAIAAVGLLISAVLQIAGPHTKVNELTLGLIFEHRRFVLDLIGAIVETVGWLALSWTLWYLFDCTRAREKKVPSYIGIVALVGGPLAGLGILGYVISYGLAAQSFVSHGAQTYPQAHHLLSGGALNVFQIVDYLGELVLALGFVMVSLNAMRVGLLTRFLGFLGIIGGVLTLFVITPVPIVQFYWLAAVAYLLSGRWPNGLPPAWRTGKVERWPSSQELREQQARARAGKGRAPAITRDAVPASAGAGSGGGRGSGQQKQRAASASASRSNAKRKRKRRK